jgi:hypothetical protein
MLTLLSKFEAVDDRESDTAFFKTHVPRVAPQAYLNIIHKPAAPDVLKTVATRLRIPPPWTKFLAQYNGAILFSSALYIFGVAGPGQMLNRDSHFSLPPINIENSNRTWPPPDRDRNLKIASYGFDGSNVCIDRNDLDICVFRRSESKSHCSWKDTGQWLSSEIGRLSKLFSSSGKLLVDDSETLPAQINKLGLD